MKRIGKKRWQTLVRRRETFVQKAIMLELEIRSLLESRLTREESDYLDSVWLEKSHMLRSWIESDFDLELSLYKEAE